MICNGLWLLYTPMCGVGAQRNLTIDYRTIRLYVPLIKTEWQVRIVAQRNVQARHMQESAGRGIFHFRLHSNCVFTDGLKGVCNLTRKINHFCSVWLLQGPHRTLLRPSIFSVGGGYFSLRAPFCRRVVMNSVVVANRPAFQWDT